MRLVSLSMGAGLVPRSLVWATDLDVLPLDRVIARGGGYLVVRSPSNPSHYWGNLLLFEDPPVPGDGERWEWLFEAEFRCDPRVQHRTFAWDRVDGAIGSAREEFLRRGYRLEQTVGLIAEPDGLVAHRRANPDVVVRPLAPEPGCDERLWSQVVELQVAAREEYLEESDYRAFRRKRLQDLRAVFTDGRGAWYVALAADRGEVLGSCGLVVTARRGRFQAVDTAAAYRRRGICSRLILDAAEHAGSEYGASRFVIAADPDYHALGLYESLGFQRTEHVSGVFQPPIHNA